MNRALPIILIVIGVLLAVLNAVQFADRKSLRAELDSQRARAETTASRQGRRPGVGTPLTAQTKPGKRTPQRKSDHSPTPGELTAEQGESEDDEGLQEIAEQWAKMMENPAMQKQMLAQMDAQVGPALAALYAHLELDGEDLEHFKGLLAERWLAQQQVGMKMMSAAGDPEKNATIKKELKEAREATEEKVREFLNDEQDFAFYQQYQTQLPDRMELEQFSTALEAEGLSLQEGQMDQLLTAMGEERVASELGDVSNPEGWDFDNFDEGTVTEVMGKMSDFHQRVQVRAGVVLDEAQLQVLTASQEQQRTMQEMGMKMGLQFMENARKSE